MSYSLVEGDLAPDMRISVLEGSTAKDLSSAIDISLRWTQPDGTYTEVPLVAVDLVSGQLKRVWSASDSSKTGTHLGQVAVTWLDGSIETFPNDGSHIIWNVYPKLA